MVVAKSMKKMMRNIGMLPSSSPIKPRTPATIVKILESNVKYIFRKIYERLASVSLNT